MEVIIPIVSVIVAVFAAVFAWRSAKVAEAAREDLQTPFLFIFNSQGRLTLQNIGTGIAKDITWLKTENIAIHDRKLPSVLLPFHGYTKREEERRHGQGVVTYDIAGGQLYIKYDEIATVILRCKNVRDKTFDSRILIQKISVNEYLTYLATS